MYCSLCVLIKQRCLPSERDADSQSSEWKFRITFSRQRFQEVCSFAMYAFAAFEKKT
jgi:hypothetical protein